MALDPRRSGVGLWVAWLAAGALGGGVATLVAIGPLGAVIPDLPGISAFPWTFAVAAAVFQAVVLWRVGTGWSAVALWLPATIVGVALYPWLTSLWLNAEPAVIRWLTDTFNLNAFQVSGTVDGWRSVTYAIALGAMQGVALTVITRRKAPLAIWLGANIVGWAAMAQAVQPLVQVEDSGPANVIGNAIMYGVYSAPVGLALVAIVRRQQAEAATQALPAAPVPS